MVFLLVYGLSTQQNIDLILKACSHADQSISLIGTGPLLDQMKVLAQALKVDARFLGKVPHEDLPKVMNQHRALILYSSYEGNPKVVLEAMANGCLVIGRENKNINEIIKHNLNGILYNSNDNLLEIIESVIRNKTKFEMLTEEGYEYILNTNHIDKIIKIEQESYKYLAKS